MLGIYAQVVTVEAEDSGPLLEDPSGAVIEAQAGTETRWELPGPLAYRPENQKPRVSGASS